MDEFVLFRAALAGGLIGGATFFFMVMYFMKLRERREKSNE